MFQVIYWILAIVTMLVLLISFLYSFVMKIKDEKDLKRNNKKC